VAGRLQGRSSQALPTPPEPDTSVQRSTLVRRNNMARGGAQRAPGNQNPHAGAHAGAHAGGRGVAKRGGGRGGARRGGRESRPVANPEQLDKAMEDYWAKSEDPKLKERAEKAKQAREAAAKAAAEAELKAKQDKLNAEMEAYRAKAAEAAQAKDS
jgi:hypothetical protein